MIPAADQWPNFLYPFNKADYSDDEDSDSKYSPPPVFNFDATEPWNGFGQGQFLVKVMFLSSSESLLLTYA